MLRLWPLLLIAVLLAAAVASGLTDWLSLERLRAEEGRLRAFVDGNLPLALLMFAAVYAVATGLSVPGAVVLTLAGGFLFGTWVGGAATAVGATLGAVALWAAVRTALGEPLRRKAEADGGRLRNLIDGVRRNAFSTVLTLRLIPFAPFWLVNAAAGIAAVPLRAYVPATFLGILPATFIYSGIGEGLREVFATGGEVDLATLARPFFLPLLGLAALSLLPTIYKAVRGRKPGLSA